MLKENLEYKKVNNMTWKSMIRKEISDKDMKEMLEEDYDEEFQTGERGSDNSVQRDRDDTFDPVVREKMEHFNKIGTHTVREMLEELQDFIENTMPAIKKIVNEKVLREQLALAISFLERQEKN